MVIVQLKRKFFELISADFNVDFLGSIYFGVRSIEMSVQIF